MPVKQPPLRRTAHPAAWSVLALALAGCPNAGLAPPLPGDGAFTPAPLQPAAASVPPSATPASELPGASTSPAGVGGAGGITRSPSAAPSPARSGATALLQGLVFDEKGATVEGATVTARSLDTTQPYSVTATTRAGSWVVNGVPEGVQVEVTVSRAGWTRRTRVVALQAGAATRNTLNFGALPGATAPDDLAGAAHFISDQPELASASPDAGTLRGEKLSYKLRFSEPLDADNRLRVEDAFALDAAPVPSDLMPDGLTAFERASRVVIKKGASFRAGRARVAFAWNEAADELAVTFDAPLRRLEDDRVAYRFQLVRPEGAGLIEDGNGNVLGLVAPAVGDAYFGVRKGSLVVAPTDTTASLRWQSTHQRTASFEVEKDAVEPLLQAVAVTRRTLADRGNAAFYQLDLTFSEPMRVYPDEKGYAASLVKLDNYVFAMSEKALDAVDLSKGTPGTFDAATQSAATFDATYSRPQAPFRFADDADPATKDATDVFVQPSDDSPKVVSVYVPVAALPVGLKHVKVLARRAIVDPAGNGLSEANAKPATNTADNVVLGAF
jgi:hypothetical protein